MTNKITFAIGTNVPNRENFILAAISNLKNICKVTNISKIYESKAWGVTNQASFLNFCLSAETKLTPEELLIAIKDIEKKVGRVKREHWGPREIDIDIVYFNDFVINEEHLTIPHPYLSERSFFLKPITDIEPDFIHPILKKSNKELNLAVSDKDLKLYNPLFKKLKMDTNTLIMGIVNLTKDSFSKDGLLINSNFDLELEKKLTSFIKEGIDIIDIGAESTKPGFTSINIEEEIELISKAILKIKSITDLPISIDTRNATTAKEALKLEAHMINCVSGKFDEDMFSVVREFNCPFVIMHNSSDKGEIKKDHFSKSEHKDIVKEVFSELDSLINKAIEFGIAKDKLIIDPGIGFGKTVKENIKLINKLEVFKKLNVPLLFGGSRKSFIGKSLDLDISKRLAPTLASQTIAQTKGARILRVHDVEEAKHASQITDLILNS